MERDNNLQFIRQKIYEIKNAVMYSMSNDLVRMPNNIVTVLKVDDEGQLWFLCNPPSFKVEECEAVFPARLHFYRKGKFFHIEVSGKAIIMNREYEANLTTSEKKPVLIKMSMNNIEYTVINEKRPKGRIEVMLENGYKWLLKTIAIPRHEKSVLSKLHQTS
jgi:general stress protein 26